METKGIYKKDILNYIGEMLSVVLVPGYVKLDEFVNKEGHEFDEEEKMETKGIYRKDSEPYIGEMLTVNCSSIKHRPKANITIYIGEFLESYQNQAIRFWSKDLSYQRYLS